MAYKRDIKDENNVKIVQGVPVGGQNYLGNGYKTGAIKIKLPTKGTNTVFDYDIIIFSDINDKNIKLRITGQNSPGGFGSYGIFCRAIIEGSLSNFVPKVYFCTGTTEDYVLIGEIDDTWSYTKIVIDNIKYRENTTQFDWSTGWDISLVTTLENLTAINKVTVIPSLNATHVNGTMTSNAQGGITQKKTSTMALEVENDAGMTFFNVNTTDGKITERLSASVTPANNQEMEFQLTSNTQLTIKVKGTDGIVRSANITLS